MTFGHANPTAPQHVYHNFSTFAGFPDQMGLTESTSSAADVCIVRAHVTLGAVERTCAPDEIRSKSYDHCLVV